MKIYRDCKAYELTPMELEEAYREKQMEYRCSDASEHLANLFEDQEDHFFFTYGMTLDAASKDKSLLNEIVQYFERHFNACHDEDEQWEEAITTLLDKKELPLDIVVTIRGKNSGITLNDMIHAANLLTLKRDAEMELFVLQCGCENVNIFANIASLKKRSLVGFLKSDVFQKSVIDILYNPANRNPANEYLPFGFRMRIYEAQ